MALSPFPHTIPTIFSFSYLTVLGDNTAGLFSDISGLAVKLLVVESEAPLAAHLKRLLEQAGMSVETAENGIEGEIKAYCGRYDMVVVDCSSTFALTAAISWSSASTRRASIAPS